MDERQMMVMEMRQLEQTASRLLKKRPFTDKDGLQLKEVMTRIKVNYVALGRTDANPALKELDRALAPLVLLLAARCTLAGMVMPAGVIAMLSNINGAFTNLINMFPLIAMSQIGAGMSRMPLAMPLPVPSMGMRM